MRGARRRGLARGGARFRRAGGGWLRAFARGFVRGFFAHHEAGQEESVHAYWEPRRLRGLRRACRVRRARATPAWQELRRGLARARVVPAPRLAALPERLGEQHRLLEREALRAPERSVPDWSQSC